MDNSTEGGHENINKRSSSSSTQENNTFNDMLSRLIESADLEPIMVACTVPPPNKPVYFGEEFHGKLTREDEKRLLGETIGRYLVRDSFTTARSPHEYTLAFYYKGIQHVKLIFNPQSRRFTDDLDNSKEFPSVSLLVADVLELFRKLGGNFTHQKKEVAYRKPHSFKPYSYKHPKWCDCCKQFLWGFFNQGYKCEDCETNVHKSCRENAKLPCEKVVVAPRKISIHGDKERHGSLRDEEEEPFHPVSRKVNSANECRFFRQCSRFLSAFNIRDIYISMESMHTRCFCDDCLLRSPSNQHQSFKSFNHWTKFRFIKQHKESTKNWVHAYFAIKPQYITAMLSQCYDEKLEDKNFDLIVASDFSSTVKDMMMESWSYKFNDTHSDSELYAQTALEVLICPKSKEEFSLENDMSSGTHWRIRNTKAVHPISVFVRIFKEPHPDGSIS